MLFKKAILRLLRKPKDCFFLSARRLCFPDKFCPANRAGNLDFSFAAWDAQFIFAFGAFIIPMILITPLCGPGSEKALDLIPDSEKFLIFRPPFRGIAGQHAKEHQKEQKPGQNREHHNPCHHAQKPQEQIQNQKSPVQLISSVSPIKETL